MCLEHDGTICVGIAGQLWVQFDVQNSTRILEVEWQSILNTRISRASPHSDYPTGAGCPCSPVHCTRPSSMKCINSMMSSSCVDTDVICADMAGEMKDLQSAVD